MVLKEEIIDALRDVYDPEIPINVYDLGLIYDIVVKENGYVHILMSLTSPTCPTADYIQEMIHDAVSSVEGVSSVDVEITFDPLWTPDRVSNEAKEELGLNVDGGDNDDNLINNVFNSNSSNNSNNIKSNQNKLSSSDSFEVENICFNCGCDDSKFPILNCVYKGENTKICSKCLIKFN